MLLFSSLSSLNESWRSMVVVFLLVFLPPSHFYDRCRRDYVELRSAARNVPAGLLAIQTVQQQHQPQKQRGNNKEERKSGLGNQWNRQKTLCLISLMEGSLTTFNWMVGSSQVTDKYPAIRRKKKPGQRSTYNKHPQSKPTQKGNVIITKTGHSSTEDS